MSPPTRYHLIHLYIMISNNLIFTQSPEWSNVRLFDRSVGKTAWCYVSACLAFGLPLVAFFIIAYSSGYDGVSYFIPQVDR